MFSRRLIDARRSRLEEAYSRELGIPGFSFKEHSLAEVDEFGIRLRGAFGEEGEQLRPLAREEELFILSELNLSKIDWLYWSSQSGRNGAVARESQPPHTHASRAHHRTRGAPQEPRRAPEDPQVVQGVGRPPAAPGQPPHPQNFLT